jgi:hydroxymethylglutaryl-CoA reductase (NADPH)
MREGNRTLSTKAPAGIGGNGVPAVNGAHAKGNGLAKLTPPRGYTKEDSALRRQWLATRTGASISSGVFDEPEKLQGLIENHVGYVGLPMSIAGPLTIDGSFAKGEFYVPLCTVEGTLSFSMTRGCYLAHLAGGISTRHFKQELSRAPVFVFGDVAQAARFIEWIGGHFSEIKAAAESTTRFGKLLRIDKYPVHNRVILDFVYHTAEAAGQNMVTLATDRACRWILEQARPLGAARYLVESNFCGDKNPTHRTLLHGRGHHVIASLTVPERLLRKVLRVGVDDIVQCSTDKQIGSQLAGVLGFNLHVANALAAIYLATGQDAACVAENAVGITTFDRHGGDLHATLSMPSITIGTVGGATRLLQQQNNLKLLGCAGGPNSSKKLAEIICAAALALEISLAGAIISNEFAAAHAKFGRK